jgi:hypothetical protein
VDSWIAFRQLKQSADVRGSVALPDGTSPYSTGHNAPSEPRVTAGSARNSHGANAYRDMVCPLNDRLSFCGPGESASARHRGQAH